MEYKRHKMLTVQTKVVGDPSEGRIHAVVSTENKDRDGDIIRQGFWDLESFNQHPVLMTSHDYRSLLSQIGTWEDMQVTGTKGIGGPRLEGIAHYHVGQGNPEADWGFNLAAKGEAAYSVGFIPDMSKAEELKGGDSFFTNYEFKGQELLEVSHVTIPSNREALQLMSKRMAPDDFELVMEIIKSLGPAPATVIEPSGIVAQDAFVKLLLALTESTQDIAKILIDLSESVRLARPDDPKSFEEPINLATLATDTIKKVLLEAGNHGS